MCSLACPGARLLANEDTDFHRSVCVDRFPVSLYTITGQRTRPDSVDQRGRGFLSLDRPGLPNPGTGRSQRSTSVVRRQRKGFDFFGSRSDALDLASLNCVGTDERRPLTVGTAGGRSDGHPPFQDPRTPETQGSEPERAQRNPTKPYELDGSWAKRSAACKSHRLANDPPRRTRDSPESGPWGLRSGELG
jgi:hypothetical protein